MRWIRNTEIYGLSSCTSKVSGNMFEKLWALSIQQKFQCEITEIPRAEWNGTLRLHRPDPSHRAFGYCSCKQDTKERYWEQQFCQVGSTDRNVWATGPGSEQTEMVRSICYTNRNFRNLGFNGWSAQHIDHYYSFKIFLRFWVAKTPRIIYHN